jgi:hypothetical protein
MKRVVKSIWAVFAGFAAVFILSTATDFILESLGIFPPVTQGLSVTWMLVLALAYRSAYAVLGGYITARLAPSNPMKHTMILACIGLVFAIAGIFLNESKSLGPTWYPILLAVLTIPCVWLGGKLYGRK